MKDKNLYKPITFRLLEELIEKLCTYRYKNKVTYTYVVNKALKEFFERNNE